MRRMISAGPPAKRPPHIELAGLLAPVIGRASRLQREDGTMKWTSLPLLWSFLLVAPGLGRGGRGEADMPDRAKLGEFVPCLAAVSGAGSLA